MDYVDRMGKHYHEIDFVNLAWLKAEAKIDFDNKS